MQLEVSLITKRIKKKIALVKTKTRGSLAGVMLCFSENSGPSQKIKYFWSNLLDLLYKQCFAFCPRLKLEKQNSPINASEKLQEVFDLNQTAFGQAGLHDVPLWYAEGSMSQS